MPKYTHQKLEVYLKQDAKVIKKRSPQLKLSNILNSLSTLFGYKNFNELQKRDLDTTIVSLISLKYNDLTSVLNKYKNFIEVKLIKNGTEPNIGYFFVSKLDYLRCVLKIYCKLSDNKLLPEKYIDFTDHKTSVNFNNEDFVEIISFHIGNNSKKQVDKVTWKLSEENFLLIIDIMKYFKVDSFQKEILKWTDLNLLLNSFEQITDKDLKSRLNSYFNSIDTLNNPMQKYQNHQRIFNSLINLMFHPFFNINESKNIFKFEYLKNNYNYDQFKKYKKVWLIFHEDYMKYDWFEFIARL